MPPKSHSSKDPATSSLAGVVEEEAASASMVVTTAATTPASGRRTLSRRERYPPGIFTNANGNLRYVALTVRHPCKLFWLILFVTLLLVVGLFGSFVLEIQNSEDGEGGGNPFSDPGSGQYNIKDIRSLTYDSLRLAVKEVKTIREDNNDNRRRLRFLSEDPVPPPKSTMTATTTWWSMTFRDALVSAGFPLDQYYRAIPSSTTRITAFSSSTTPTGADGQHHHLSMTPHSTKSSSASTAVRRHHRRRQRKLQSGNSNNDTSTMNTSSRGEEDKQQQQRRPQEQLNDITYWVYEAETDGGVFGSADSIRAMRESHDLFLQDKGYELFCWKEYDTVFIATTTDSDSNSTNTTTATTTTMTTETTSKCRAPSSPLNIYYPSSYNPEIATAIIDQLEIPENVVIYNTISLCLEFDLLCEILPTEYQNRSSLMWQWAASLNENITILSDAWDGTGPLIDENNIQQVTLLMAHLLQLRTKRGLVDFGLDKNFALNNTKSQFSRAIFFWGGPLAHTSNPKNDALSDEDRDEQDEEELKEYVVDNFLQKMDKIASPGHSPFVNTYYFMTTLILEVLLNIVIRDALFAFASFGFVFLYLRLTVGSWFLSTIGMAEIMLSVPVSWFFYKVVCQIEYFAFLSVLTLFIVAAIGADDIFIFMDAYKQSAYSNDPEVLEDLESRMSWVYRRTGASMFITSATTCAAFLSTIITPLVDIRSFGIFAAFVIAMDYILVMTLFCTAVVIYHNKFERPGCCSTCTSGCRTADPSSTTTSRQNIGNHNEEQIDCVSRFFRNSVAPFIGAPISRIVVAVLFVAWVSVASFYAIKIEPTKEAEQFLRSDNPLQKSLTIINSAFLTTEDDIGLEVYFAWGIGEVDRDGVNQLFDPEFLGEPKFVDSFQFTEQCQTELMTACTTLRSNASYQPHIKQENGLGTVSCFIEEFAAYSVLASLSDCVSVVTGTWRSGETSSTWPVPVADLPDKLAGFLRERSCYSDEGFPVLNHYSNEIGWDGTKLRFVALKMENSVVDPFSSLPEDVVRKEYDALLKIADDLDQKIGAACGVGTGTVVMTDQDQKFIFMNNQSIYRRSALQSALLGIGLAFTVLLVSTRVFHIAFFATICIAAVLISVTGVMVLIGWTLGSTESVLISIVAGFAVDYVVHLAHSYAQAYGNSAVRMQTAFSEMGISVLHGMVTSVGASVPLFFCELTFFRKFGTFMFLTITFSWLFANFVFMSALAQFRLRVSKYDNDAPDVVPSKPPTAAAANPNPVSRTETITTAPVPPSKKWTTLDDGDEVYA